MNMSRALYGLALALCAAGTACSDGTEPPTNEPPPDDEPTLPDVFTGRWLLVAINGEALPALNRIQNRVVLDGVLDLPTSGPAAWEYCYDTLAAGSAYSYGLRLYDFDLDDGQAEVWIDFNGQDPAVDTIRVADDTLAWDYNLRSVPGAPVTDALRFRRLQPLEHRATCGRP